MPDSDFIVMYADRGEKEIERELRKLDPDLFLDKEIDYRGGPVYYLVKHHIGSGHPPVAVLAWKENDGRPKPLTHGIVEAVKRQEGAMDGAMREALANIENRREKQREQSAATYEQLVEEHLPRLKAADGRTLTPYWRPRRFGAN